MNLGGRSEDIDGNGAVDINNSQKKRSFSNSVKKKDSPIPRFEVQNLLGESDNHENSFNEDN